MNKTNVMRILDQRKIQYNAYEYDPSIVEGTAVAGVLGEAAEHVFKTLVTASGNGMNFVFVIPVAETLDLKKAAIAASVKAISMIKQKELFPLTGYVHGGCCPIGMRKQFATYIHSSAKNYATIFISAGRVGCQIEISPNALSGLIRANYFDLISTVQE